MKKKIYLLLFGLLLLFGINRSVMALEPECTKEAAMQLAKIVYHEAGRGDIGYVDPNEAFFAEITTANIILNNANTSSSTNWNDKIWNVNEKLNYYPCFGGDQRYNNDCSKSYGGENYRLKAFDSFVSDDKKGELLYISELVLTGKYSIPRNIHLQAAKDIVVRNGQIWDYVDVKSPYYDIYFGYSRYAPDTEKLATVDVFGRNISDGSSAYFKKYANSLKLSDYSAYTIDTVCGGLSDDIQESGSGHPANINDDIYQDIPICENPEILKVIFFGKILLDIIRIVIPVGMIVMAIMDFSKGMISSDESSQKKKMKLLIKRIVMGIMVFVIPWLVGRIIVLLGNLTEEVNFTDCIENANEDIIKELEEKYDNNNSGTINDNSDDNNGGIINDNSDDNNGGEVVSTDGYSTGYLVSPINPSATRRQYIDSIGPNSQTLYYLESGEYRGQYHGGTDLPVVRGTFVYAMDGGTVYKVQNGYGNYGRHIILQHIVNDRKYYTLYAHLSKIEDKYLKSGTKVNKGDFIGRSGASGVNGENDFAAHLHVSISYDSDGVFPGRSSGGKGSKSFLITNFVGTDNNLSYGIVDNNNLKDYTVANYDNDNSITIVNTNKTIFIGDSRTWQLCYNVKNIDNRLDYYKKKCSFEDNNGPFEVDNDIKNEHEIYISSKDKSDYKWLKDSAVPAINDLTGINVKKYTIVSLMGVNGLEYKKYIEIYNNLVKNDWSKQNVVLVSVMPVNEEKKGNDITNSEIKKFNDEIKKSVTSSNVKYCDIYSEMIDNTGKKPKNDYTMITRFDYKPIVYSKIYDLIYRKCL